ncbi:MAG: HAMP domain-containing protein [Clostridiales bacterium]|nr:HAMP domain-containing protein [Clostridiales bacterium]
MNIKKLVAGILLSIAACTLLGSAGIFLSLAQNSNDAQRVNDSGKIRGGVQRAVKLHLLDEPKDEVIANIDDLINLLLHGDDKQGIRVSSNKNFLEKIQQIQGCWEDSLKPLITGNVDDPKALMKYSEEIFRLANEATQMAEENSNREIWAVKIILYVFTGVMILFLAAIALVIRRKILVPIQLLENNMANVAQGDLSAEISHFSKDEFGMLAESIRETVHSLSSYISAIQAQLHELAKGNLNIEIEAGFRGDFVELEKSLCLIATDLSRIMEEIDRSADRVASNSDLLHDNVQSLSASSMETAQFMEELSQSTQDIRDKVNNTADNALQAGGKVQEVREEIDHCGVQMKELQKAMQEISQYSQEISKITKTIEDISFQTNILALNASVEAARAGAAGKGFAVVAEEVRNLANLSNEAVQNTAGLIEETVNAVKNGTKIADQTAGLLAGVIEASHEVTNTMNLITDAAVEQSKTIDELTDGIHQVADSVQSNSSITQQCASESEELSEEAKVLKKLVNGFTLREEERKCYHDQCEINPIPYQ